MDSYKIYNTGYASYRVYPNGDIFTTPHTVEFVDGHSQVYKSRKKKIFIQTLKDGSKGYPQVSLQYGKEKGKVIGIHRILAELFIPNPKNLPQVNHIDGNKMNYSLDNLEWVSVSENNKHAYDVGLRRPITKRVYCKELDRIFDSIKEAAMHIKGDRRSISNACCGRSKTYKKMHGEYVD